MYANPGGCVFTCNTYIFILKGFRVKCRSADWCVCVSAGMSLPAVDVEWGGEEAGAEHLVNDGWPPGAPESQEKFFVEHHTWNDLRNILTDSQRGQFNMVSKPPHEFQFVLKNDPEGLHSHRVYFLGEEQVKHICYQLALPLK